MKIYDLLDKELNLSSKYIHIKLARFYTEDFETCILYHLKF